MAPPVDFIVPNPLVSRDRPVFASTGAAASAWVAVQVGVGPSHVLVSWTVPGTDYSDAEHAPAEYRIESSADSTNGTDGTWRLEIAVTGNAVRARAHSFEFDGQSWVRLVVAGAAKARELSGLALDVHDASDGTDDTWLFLGDSMSVVDRRTPSQPSFAENIHAEYPGCFPALIDGAVRGELTTHGLARLGSVLALNPDFRHFAIAYGVHDWRAGLDAAQFRATLQAIIDQLRAAGRVPVLARVPLSPGGNGETFSDYIRVIDELTQDNGLLPGPDLYAWFQAHPEQLTNEGRPDSAGRAAVHRLWADAMDPLYAPQ